MDMNPRQILTNTFAQNGGFADFRSQPNAPVPITIPNAGTYECWVKGHSFQIGGTRYWQNNKKIPVIGLVFHWMVAENIGVDTQLINKINPLHISEIYYFRTIDMAWMGTAVTQLYPTLGSLLRMPELTKNLTFWIKNDTPLPATNLVYTDDGLEQNLTCSVRAGAPLVVAPSIMNPNSATMSNRVIASKLPFVISWKATGTKLKYQFNGLTFRVDTLTNKIDQVEVNLGTSSTTLVKI